VELANHLQNVYTEDLEDNFQNECIHFQAHIKNKDNMSIHQLCTWLKEYGMYEMYPDIDIAIRILACTLAANCQQNVHFHV